LLAAAMHVARFAKDYASRTGADEVGDAVMKLSSRRIRALALWRGFGDDHASQIAEFAVSLPLLVLFVVGIFDFSGAVTLKQKLTNAAREGARVAAADPANDLVNTTPLPVSVADAWQVVDNYLVSEKINDCQLGTAVPSGGNLIWTYTASCPGGGSSNALVLTINRGCVTAKTVGQNTTYVVNSCVTLSYPYTWKFGGVSGLFGGRFTGPTAIATTAVAFNEN
jgi:Flp pilus assembly protein TadG